MTSSGSEPTSTPPAASAMRWAASAIAYAGAVSMLMALWIVPNNDTVPSGAVCLVRSPPTMRMPR